MPNRKTAFLVLSVAVLVTTPTQAQYLRRCPRMTTNIPWTLARLDKMTEQN